MIDVETILAEVCDTAPEGEGREAYLSGARAALEAAEVSADLTEPDFSSLEWSGYDHRYAESVCPECNWPAPGARSGAGKHATDCSLDAAIRSPAERKARDAAVDDKLKQEKARDEAREEKDARRQLARLQERFS